jgi:hypothetical protein
VTGNIYGHVVDEQGGRLPGVTVTLSGIGAAKTQTTDSLRLEKVIAVHPLEVTLAADVFNVTNQGTVLQRNANVVLGAGVYNQIIEMQSPRVVRFGARLSF